MNNPKVSHDEQIRLIHECRTSGMSDNQWCLQHGIRPGTFYNWVSRIKKKGDVYIPDPGGAAEYWPEAKPDIVQINLVREDTKSISDPQGNAKHIVPSSTTQPENCITSPVPVMELELNGAKLRISNGIDPGLLLQVLQILRGTTC